MSYTSAMAAVAADDGISAYDPANKAKPDVELQIIAQTPPPGPVRTPHFRMNQPLVRATQNTVVARDLVGKIVI